jgi:hypothetical protein
VRKTTQFEMGSLSRATARLSKQDPQWMVCGRASCGQCLAELCRGGYHEERTLGPRVRILLGPSWHLPGDGVDAKGVMIDKELRIWRLTNHAKKELKQDRDRASLLVFATETQERRTDDARERLVAHRTIADRRPGRKERKGPRGLFGRSPQTERFAEWGDCVECPRCGVINWLDPAVKTSFVERSAAPEPPEILRSASRRS